MVYFFSFCCWFIYLGFENVKTILSSHDKRDHEFHLARGLRLLTLDNQCILRVHYVLGTILGPGATVVNKRDVTPVPKILGEWI